MWNGLRLLGYFFIADQRMSYMQSARGTLTPKPAALIPIAVAVFFGFIPGGVRILSDQGSPLAFDCFCCIALIYLAQHFPEGLMTRSERRFLIGLPIGRGKLRAFEFAHTILVGVYVGLPMALPIGYLVNYSTGNSKMAAAAAGSSLAAFYALLFSYSALFQMRPLRLERIPGVLINLLIFASIFLFAGFMRGAATITPGLLFERLEEILSGTGTRPLAQGWGAIALLIAAGSCHWRLSGRCSDETYSPAGSERPSFLSRVILRILPRASRMTEFRMMFALFIIHLWRSPRSNFIFLVVVASTALGVQTIFTTPDPIPLLSQFAGATSFSSAFIYSLLTFSYVDSSTPIVYTLGLSPGKSARAAMLLSTLIVYTILCPALFLVLLRTNSLDQFMGDALWLFLQIYCGHLLMHLIRSYPPFSYPMARAGTATLFFSYGISASSLLLLSPAILLQQSIPMKSAWVLVGILGVLVAFLFPVVRRVSDRRLRYLNRSAQEE